jgi:hypothetical protein
VEIVRKALARRVEDRFQSATDLQDALAHYWFSRGLKMIQRDIADLVRACQEEQTTASTSGQVKRPNLIDTILHEELDAFTSVGFDGQALTPGPAAINPASVHRPTGGFIDPRAWSQETDWPARRTGAQLIERLPRDTQADMAAARASTARPTAGSPPPEAAAQVRSTPSGFSAPESGRGAASLADVSGFEGQQMALPDAMRPLDGRRSRGSTPAKGLLIGVMLAAVAAGALLAWILVGR